MQGEKMVNFFYGQLILNTSCKLYVILIQLAGIPRMLFYGNYKEGPEIILVLELVGPSLMDIIEKKDLNRFSLKTMLMVGIQIVRIATFSILSSGYSQTLMPKTHIFFLLILVVSNRIHTQQRHHIHGSQTGELGHGRNRLNQQSCSCSWYVRYYTIYMWLMSCLPLANTKSILNISSTNTWFLFCWHFQISVWVHFTLWTVNTCRNDQK